MTTISNANSFPATNCSTTSTNNSPETTLPILHPFQTKTGEVLIDINEITFIQHLDKELFAFHLTNQAKPISVIQANLDFSKLAPYFLLAFEHITRVKYHINSKLIQSVEIIDATNGMFPAAIYAKCHTVGSLLNYIRFEKTLAEHFKDLREKLTFQGGAFA